MRYLKIKTTIIMALVMCVSLFLGFNGLTKATSKASAATPTTFEMLGMSIRYSDAYKDDGIRFGVKIDLTTYNALINDDDARAGILVTPADQIVGVTLSLQTAEASKARNGCLYSGSQDTNNWYIDGDHAIGIVYLHGFPEESYNRPITAVAYIDWDDDCSVVNYSDTVSISMSDVALAISDDYADANLYGTTAEQAEKLDDYLLYYDIEFLDAFGVMNTQSVKYGDEFELPDSPASRVGFEFTGWHKKNAGSTYAIAATDFNAVNAKKVRYATTYKAGFDADGPSYEKPGLDVSSAVFTEGSWSRIDQTHEKIRMNGSAYLFDGVTIPYGDYDDNDEDAEYSVSATFKPITGAGKVYPKVGFTFSGAEGKHLEIAYDAYNDKIRVYQKGDGSKYRYYNNESGIVPYSEGNDLPNDYESTTFTVTYKNPKFFYMYIDGQLACEINLRFNYYAGGAGGNTEKHCATIGTGSDLKIGLSVDNGYAEFYDWSCRLTENEWEPLITGADSYCLTGSETQNAYSSMTQVKINNGAYLISGVSFPDWTSNVSDTSVWKKGDVGGNPTFQISAKVKEGSTATDIGFVFTTNKSDILKVTYNKSTGRVRVEYGAYYREYNVIENLYEEDADNSFTIRYDGSVFMEFYINGISAITNGDSFTFDTGAQENVTKKFINLRYGFDGDNSSGVGGVKAWQGFGNGNTLYAGICASGGSAAITVNPKSYKVLSIGSSFATDAHRYLHDIALRDNVNIYTVNLFYSGCNLEQHAGYLKNASKAYNYEQNGLRTDYKVSIQDMIHKEDWDVITVQNSSARSTRYDTFFPYLTELVEYIREECPSANLYLHETWSYADGSAKLEETGYASSELMYNAISDAHERAASEAGVDGIIYSGKTMLEAIKIYNEDIFRDSQHASRGEGRYLLALVWYKTITGEDVSDNGFNSFDEAVSDIVKQNIIQIVNNN